MGWMAIALFNSEFSRELYKATVSVSVLGPFAGHIIGLVYVFTNADAMQIWNYWYLWLVWPLYIVYVAGQMFIQFLWLPDIYDLLESDVLDYGFASL